MRREEREIRDPGKIEAILRACRVCRLAFTDPQGLYLLPMNFGYALEEGQLTLYFHSAQQGRKARLLQAGSVSCAFEMDLEQGITGTGDLPCVYGCRYQSIVGTGVAEVIREPLPKKEALARLMLQQTGRAFQFSDAMLNGVLVFQVVAERFSAKGTE